MNSDASWVLRIDKSVYKELAGFPKKNTERILDVLENNFDPYADGIEKIKGEKILGVVVLVPIEFFMK